MSNYRSMIDQALEAARARAHAPVETVKAASAEDALIKEANDLANALEFVSLSASGGDNAAGFRQEMIRDFYKSASSPAHGPTAASGVQGIAPAAGKKKLAPAGLVGGNSPAQGSTTPEARDGQKTLLESFKQGSGQSLYDMLMSNKTAGAGGPAEHDSETMAGVGTANENSTYRKTLHTNEGPVNANRRDLKKNTRARLAEVFGHTNDNLGDATAAQIFPQAAARGNLKIAMDPRAAAALGGGAGSAIPYIPLTGTLGSGLAAKHSAPDSMSQEEKDRLQMAASAGSLTGGTLGRLMSLANPAGYNLGKILGSAGGGALGAHLAMQPKEAAAIGGALLGGALLGGAIGAASADEKKRKEGAFRGAVLGGLAGGIGKYIRKTKIDKTVGKADSLSDVTKKTFDSLEADDFEGLQSYYDSLRRNAQARRMAYDNRPLKGATGVAAGLAGAGGGLSTRGKEKKSANE